VRVTGKSMNTRYSLPAESPELQLKEVTRMLEEERRLHAETRKLADGLAVAAATTQKILAAYERVLETCDTPSGFLTGLPQLEFIVGQWRQIGDPTGKHYRAYLASDDIRCAILDAGHPLGDDSDPELTPLRLVRELVEEHKKLKEQLGEFSDKNEEFMDTMADATQVLEGSAGDKSGQGLGLYDLALAVTHRSAEFQRRALDAELRLAALQRSLGEATTTLEAIAEGTMTAKQAAGAAREGLRQ
jgi:hypothetical protein